MALRQEVNQRLRENKPYADIARWLNSLPKVLMMLAREFNGGAVTKQNLSFWKSGGYRDWLRNEIARETHSIPAAVRSGGQSAPTSRERREALAAKLAEFEVDELEAMRQENERF